jgi:hypothetical protein
MLINIFKFNPHSKSYLIILNPIYKDVFGINELHLKLTNNLIYFITCNSFMLKH